ncbi:MAG: tetratricopeptide repeat protein [Ignavibacteriales bacterium]|nr:tetratricopeptide repeat protein [Ignavibacteriales bacterium]
MDSFSKGNYESSFKLFNLLSQSKDDSIALKSLYWSGESKRYEGKYDESIEIQKRFALKYPNHPLAESVRLNIGISKFSEDNFEASEESLLQAINSPDPIARSKSYTLLGEINLKKKDYSKAKSFFQNGINISQIPKELKDRCLLGLGVSNYYLNDNIEAIKNFNAINEGDTELDKSKLYFYRAEANFVLGNYSKSISDYNSIKAEDAQMTNNVSYGKGYSYFNLKDFGKSAYYFTEFIQNSSNDKKVNECQLRLADCFYAEKDFVKASTYYQRALINSDEFNNDERAFFNYAQSLFKSGSYTDAIKVLEQIQLKFPASSYADDSQYLIGWIAFQRNEFDEAIKNYNILIDRYQQSTLLPIAYYSIGDSYFNRGEYSKAVASYNRLIAQYPNSQYVFDAVNGIQYSFIVQDQQDNAINYLRDFISNHSGLDFLDKIQFKIGEIYYSANNYEAAILEYEKLIDNYPKSGLIPQTYYWLGKSLFILNRPEEAISFFEFVKNGYLNTEEGFNSVLELGNIFRKMNNSAAETVLYDEVIPKLSDSKRISEIKFVKAQSYIASEKIPEAYEALKEIVDLRDGSLFNHKAEIELGILELARGNFENSLSLFEDVAKNRKDDLAAQALYYIGLNYFQQERIPEAITELIKVRSVYSLYDEWYTKSLLLLGDCYVINGAKGDAADMYKAVLKRHRKNQYAEEAKEKLDKL